MTKKNHPYGNLKRVIYEFADGSIMQLKGDQVKRYLDQLYQASDFCQAAGLKFEFLAWEKTDQSSN